MSTSPDPTLAAALRRFLGEYLPRQRAYSVHTIQSYRDSLKLLLQFAAGKRGRVCDLSLANLSAAAIRAFLAHIETRRHNSAATRNVRLAAIHSFFDYLSHEHPEHLQQALNIRSIPFKRTSKRVVEYLEAGELRAVLQLIDRSTPGGRRDYLLLALMFNTGARVQEIVSLKATDFRLATPPSVTLLGKGSKERICPLWPQTAQLIKDHFHEHGLLAHDLQPVFRNQHGTQLTRFGARLILRRHLQHAEQTLGANKAKRIHPHSLRHSTAIHLLKSGVDLSTIAHWLGHASVNTTHQYLSIDLETKRAAIAKAAPIVSKLGKSPTWSPNEDLLKWLESL